MSLIAGRAAVASRLRYDRAAATRAAGTPLVARRRTATLVGLGVLAAVTALLAALVVRANGGTFVYALDDPYIHLTMARNLALHGSYGMVPGVYESASSSPGWVALMALLVKAFPAGAEWYPLALNLLAAGGVLALVLRSQRWLFDIEPAPLRGLAYLALPLALYLPALVFVGMEHSLHALLCLGLLLMLQRALRRPLGRRELAGVAGLALLAGAIRYETLFVVGGAALALMVMPRAEGAGRGPVARLRRPELWAFLLPPAAVTAVLGLVNLHNGQYLLPNSVLAKSALGTGTGLSGVVPSLAALPDTLRSDLQMAGLLVFGGAYLAVRRRAGEQSGLWLAWGVAAVLHLLYARFGWYDRYQAYLVITGMLLALRSLPELGLTRQRVAPAVAVAVLLAALPVFKFEEEGGVPVQSHHILTHNVELGRFLAAAYPGRTVIVNDIGEVSWMHGGGLVDLWGLGSYDVLHAYRTGAMGRGFVTGLAARDGSAVAAVFGQLQGDVPSGWVAVARWVPADPAAEAAEDPGSELVFSAPGGAPAAELRAAMQRFAASLPSDQRVRWVGPGGS